MSEQSEQNNQNSKKVKLFVRTYLAESHKDSRKATLPGSFFAIDSVNECCQLVCVHTL